MPAKIIESKPRPFTRVSIDQWEGSRLPFVDNLINLLVVEAGAKPARDEVLRSGGSLSHHHGIGKLRERFLPEIMSGPLLEWSRKIKQAVDPQNVFGSANHGVSVGDPTR